MWCSGLIGAARYIVLMAHLTCMLMRAMVLVVLAMEVVLLFRYRMHAAEPLVILTTIHHMLALIAILGITAKVMNHGGAQR